MNAMLICQSMNQLKATYGERSSILDNTHVGVFFSANTPETADYISKSIGQTTVSYETEGHTGKVGPPFFHGRSASSHLSQACLMSTRQAMELSQDESIIFIGNAKPSLWCNEKYNYEQQDEYSLVIEPVFDEINLPVNLERVV